MSRYLVIDTAAGGDTVASFDAADVAETVARIIGRLVDVPALRDALPRVTKYEARLLEMEIADALRRLLGVQKEVTWR